MLHPWESCKKKSCFSTKSCERHICKGQGSENSTLQCHNTWTIFRRSCNSPEEQGSATVQDLNTCLTVVSALRNEVLLYVCVTHFLMSGWNWIDLNRRYNGLSQSIRSQCVVSSRLFFKGILMTPEMSTVFPKWSKRPHLASREEELSKAAKFVEMLI